MIEKMMWIGLLAVTVLVPGCTSVPMATVVRDAQAKTFTVKPDKATIYVYRNQSMGWIVKIGVELDGKHVGQTVAKSYIALEVAPGKHTLVSKHGNAYLLDVDVEAGNNYFIWQEVIPAGLAQNKLQLVDSATGKAGVSECVLIEAVKVANAESPREQLQHMVERLQQHPDDDALREKIIQFAQQLKPAPVVPEEAERHVASGTTALTDAKSLANFMGAVKEFEQAALAAPWYGDVYYRLGVALDKAEKYEAALRNLKLALLASPANKELKELIGQVESRNSQALAKLKAGESFRDCADCPEMVVLPASSLGLAFAMGKTEVTQRQWRAVMGTAPSSSSNCGTDCPVESVSWNDAKEFIQRLNSKTGKQYRLPSGAEWEYACRAGGSHTYCGSDNADDVAWYLRNTIANWFVYLMPYPWGNIQPVGRKQPNAFGLYDMSGNVAEWVEDCSKGDCSLHEIRGGSVNDGFMWSLRPTSGMVMSTDRSNSTTGFRVARMLP